VSDSAQATALYADRTSGEVYSDARSMVESYLIRFAAGSGVRIEPLDATGFTRMRKGSAQVEVQVLDDHGLLLLLSPIMTVPGQRKEAFYRRLLELSFIATSDAAFAIDSETDEVHVRALRRLSGLDYEEFEDLLNTVGEVADTWDNQLKKEFEHA
jgi:hypothetical protein